MEKPDRSRQEHDATKVRGFGRTDRWLSGLSEAGTGNCRSDRELAKRKNEA